MVAAPGSLSEESLVAEIKWKCIENHHWCRLRFQTSHSKELTKVNDGFKNSVFAKEKMFLLFFLPDNR